MRVAIFTDNDFGKINGVTTTLKAVLRYADGGIHPRVYTASDLGVDTPSYFATASAGVGLPWYRDMQTSAISTTAIVSCPGRRAAAI